MLQNIFRAGALRRAPLLLVGLLVLLGGAYFTWASLFGRSASSGAVTPSSVPVSTVVAGRSAIDITRTGLGTVTAWNTATITPQVSGQIIEVAFREGALVRKGDVLVRIDPRPFQAALDQAKAKLEQDQANLIASQKNLVRDQTLLTKGGFATQQTVDNEIAQVDALKASIAGDEGAIETARLNLEWSTILAPFPGVASLRNVDVGNVVSPVSSLLTITQIEPIAVDFTLPQADLAAVTAAFERGKPVVIAYDQEGKTVLDRGVLDVINNQVDTTTGTIKLKARFDNPGHRLWPGAFVQIRVVVESRPDAIAIPNQAVQRGPDGFYAWVVQDGRAHMHPLTIGPIQDDRTIVEAGVAPGDHVVVSGQYRLRDGIPVAENSPSSEHSSDRVEARR
ncbi:efflux RND transporter periplasmic adaptor subunit [Enterovirga sp. CN4-39]|uniref:efflux RND transporter periplasmic adaptor subunit n=1 Tax=Enterovirga sp. CN4-39 TaxID=3400910 RepID=UPI003C0138EB